MRKNAKEVKVIHRWRADEFDGEIPIGGDEEMLGAAMKGANQAGFIQDKAAEVAEIAGPVFKTGLWLNAHALAPFALANAGYKVATGNFKAVRTEGIKAGYAIGSYVANVFANGAYKNMPALVRGTSTAIGSGLLGARLAGMPYKSATRNAAIGFYTVAGISYAYKRFMGGR